MTLQARDCLIALSVLHKGDWNRVYMALRKHEIPSDEEVAELVSSVKSNVITIIDKDYPVHLRDGCIRPPIVLYYYGDISLLQNPDRILTVVGSREPEAYSSAQTRKLCHEMVDKDYIIASGLAYGIDTIAAEEGVVRPGHAIAVMGNGIERTYPLENTALREKIASTGLLLSEYPGRTAPDSRHFPMRNRILAGVGKATFASEVALHSGTSITVSYAMQMDRDVGLLPFHAGEDYMNNLFIKSGAALVETSEDLVSMMKGRLRFHGKFL